MNSWGNLAFSARMAPFDVRQIREDFPALRQFVYGKPLIYLDNAATTQKPRAVIDALVHFYSTDCSNIHRGVHLLSERATRWYEDSRIAVQRLLNAADAREIIFTGGTTDAINLVSQAYARPRLKPGDEILISALEHHSNIVPWQLVAEQTGAVLRVAPIDDCGDILLDEFEKLLGPRTKLVSLAHVSNALGTVNPVREIVRMAHAWNASVMVDGAQAAPHMKVDVREIDCDFYAFSGHKLYGPTGIGVLYGKTALLDAMPPYRGGGDMIRTVTFEKTSYNDLPYKFEAGTPNIAGAIGLGTAVDYIKGVGIEAIAEHEDSLLAYASSAVGEIQGVQLIGTARRKTGALSFVLDGVHPHDAGTILDREGIAVRAGHHCAQPVMERFGVPATTRASFALYNTREEVDALVRGLHKVREIFR